MGEIKSICVFCGSSPGDDPRYLAAANALGAAIAGAGIELVYGGGGTGLMGALAQAALGHGGRVTGIIPSFLSRREPPPRGAHETIEVETMHQRKHLMAERSDAFVAMPGGVGTLEELAEQLTWAQLGRHAKPLLALDVGGFWGPLLALLAHMRAAGFIRAGADFELLVARHAAEVLPMLRGAATVPRKFRADAREGVFVRPA